METHGTLERKLILGGRFLEEKYAGTGFDGQSGFEGLNLIGYDNAQKKYTSTFACSMGTGTCTGLGESDKSGNTFSFATECYCPARKRTSKVATKSVSNRPTKSSSNPTRSKMASKRK